MTTRIFLAALVSLAAVVGCGKEAPSATPPVHPDILIVLPDAKDVTYTKDYDGSVSYRLPEPHPADATLAQIRSQLEGKGWKPVPEDLMDPGVTNSHDRGWMNFIDGTRNDANVFVWSGAWESTRGDHVEYWLRYDYPKDSGPMSAKPPLQLKAFYMTAPTVNIIREDVRRRETPQPAKP